MTRRLVGSLLALFLAYGECGAWERHDLITREAFAEVLWLDSLPGVAVTTRSDRVEGLSPGYAFPFRGETPGDRIPAREILERYVDEPDRGVDSRLRVTWLENYLAGYSGSPGQRYLHGFRPPWSTHFPLQYLTVGAADERAELFYTAARLAFDRDDPYWGFRYLACALHYVQDAAQPFHASESSTAFLFAGRTAGETACVIANFHHVCQAWIARRMIDSAMALLPSARGLAEDHFRFGRPAEGVRQIAAEARANSQPLFDAAALFFDKRFREPKPVAARDVDTSQLEPAEAAERLAAAARASLVRTGRAARGFLAMARPLVRERFLEPTPPGDRPR